MLVCGLYQFTFRDFQVNFGTLKSPSQSEIDELTEFFDSRKGLHTENSMTGVFEGKNLILVQLEATDGWMVDQFMPSLRAVKENSIVFTDHYTPGFITPGTFNTEFIVQSGVIPDQTGVSSNVYAGNTFPYAMPKLFKAEGYAANSFHGNTPLFYDRLNVHANLGFTKYYSGDDMGMDDYTLDSQLIDGFDLMTADAPFYSLVITYSCHGAYNMTNPISVMHFNDALSTASRLSADYSNDPMYVHAIAHSMETDAFVRELMDRLESTGLIDDTVVIFYSDHYNYYVQDTPLLMEIKNTRDMNLIRKTDFFIYSKDFGGMKVTKPTSSLDMLPTIANLFGLDAPYEYYFGSDAFSDSQGFVFFGDDSWYDGSVYSREAELTRDVIKTGGYVLTLRAMDRILLKSDYFAN
jgi:phosphoglycerol transferase MdoB-like AlkP superfamily enzyme